MRVTTWNMHRAMDSGDSDAGWAARGWHSCRRPARPPLVPEGRVHELGPVVELEAPCFKACDELAGVRR